MNNEILLDVKNLNKTYGKSHILKNINFSMGYGEVLGYIGPNGAGKTTTIKLLLGINEADAGSEIIIDGKNVQDVKKDNIISYLPEKLNLPEYMTGREYIQHIVNIGELNGIITNDDIIQKIELTRFPELAFDKYIKTYSKGMQQRLGLMAVLINPKNKLVILDEPVSGLDPLGQSEMIEIIMTLKKQGKSIFITTHQMNEVEDLCDNIIFVKEGEIKDNRSVKSALNEFGTVVNYYKTLALKD